MEPLVDAFAHRLLLHGIGLWLGPLSYLVALVCALRLHRRGMLFATTSGVLTAVLVLVLTGLVHPPLLIGSLAIPLVVAGAFATLALPVTTIVLALSRRPQRALEALYVGCAAGALVGAANVVVLASAAV